MTEQQPTSSALEATLRTDMKDAMRAHDQVRLDTVRLALNAFHQEEVARTDEKHRQFRQPLTEQDRVALLEKQIKQRDEAAHIFRTAGRTEQAEKEEREAALLKAYLPAQMSEYEIRAVVAQLVATHGKEFRAVMPLASKETKGRADGKRVSEIVRELTS